VTWAERIPAAIEKAEREFDYMEGAITREEVALREALFGLHVGQYAGKHCDACVALRTFVEKVEAL